jgi:hypothetical protein
MMVPNGNLKRVGPLPAETHHQTHNQGLTWVSSLKSGWSLKGSVGDRPHSGSQSASSDLRADHSSEVMA